MMRPLLGLAALVPAMLTAQATAVEAGRVGTQTAVQTYQVAGITVLHRYVPNSDIVAANLYLLGGARQATAATAGLEPFLFAATEHGTRTYSRARLRQAMSRLGTAIGIDADHDWTNLQVRATPTTFDSTWAILASRITEPLLDSTDIEQVREQMLSALRQRRDDPDALLEFLADSFAFAGHAYGVAPTGSVESIRSLRRADLRKYLTEQVVRSRMLLVVVGGIPRARVEAALTRTLASVPLGSYRWTMPDTLPRRPSGLTVVPRALPTNYILGYFPGPPAGTKEARALRIATTILSGQLFAEIRTRRNLTYAVESPFVEHAQSAGGLYVTTVSPDITVDIMRQQIQGLRQTTISDEDLDQLIRQFVTDYFMKNETHAEQADFLARAYLFSGDVGAADRFVSDLGKVTPDEVQAAASKYMRNIRFVYIGDPAKAPRRSVERMF